MQAILCLATSTRCPGVPIHTVSIHTAFIHTVSIHTVSSSICHGRGTRLPEPSQPRDTQQRALKRHTVRSAAAAVWRARVRERKDPAMWLGVNKADGTGFR